MTTERDNVSGSQKLRLLRVDSLTLAVAEEDVLTITNWTEPTPLPFAAPSVLGVVSLVGRMFTVIDIATLLDHNNTQQRCSIVALRGDEQLALAVDEPLETLELAGDDVSQTVEADVIQAAIPVDGKEVLLLDTRSLFAAAIRGKERRRRRL